MQRSLGALDLGLVQLEVFVGSLDYCGHRIASCSTPHHVTDVHAFYSYVHLLGSSSDSSRAPPIPFLSHCRRRVFPVKREVLADEDSQADGA